MVEGMNVPGIVGLPNTAPWSMVSKEPDEIKGASQLAIGPNSAVSGPAGGVATLSVRGGED